MNESIISNSIFILIISVLLFFLIKYKYSEYKKNRNRRKRFERGTKLETDAEHFLKKQGFGIVDSQAIYYHNYLVNGEQRSNKLILDYIASKGGKRYIVEVKSGKSAISLNDKNSRRQLLEYDLVIKNDGLILLDMENKILQHVKFQTKEEKQENMFSKLIIALSVIAIIIPSYKVKSLIGLLLLLFWIYPNQGKKLLTILPLFKG
jgi:Holliday junction resolvase